MPLSIEICLCILICSVSVLLFTLAMHFIERTLLDQERCFAEINRSLRDEENAHDKEAKVQTEKDIRQ